jgi:hypothetical protein
LPISHDLSSAVILQSLSLCELNKIIPSPSPTPSYKPPLHESSQAKSVPSNTSSHQNSHIHPKTDIKIHQPHLTPRKPRLLLTQNGRNVVVTLKTSAKSTFSRSVDFASSEKNTS